MSEQEIYYVDEPRELFRTLEVPEGYDGQIIHSKEGDIEISFKDDRTALEVIVSEPNDDKNNLGGWEELNWSDVLAYENGDVTYYAHPKMGYEIISRTGEYSPSYEIGHPEFFYSRKISEENFNE